MAKPKKMSARRRCNGRSQRTGERCKNPPRKGMRTCGKCKGSSDPLLAVINSGITPDMSMRNITMLTDHDRLDDEHLWNFARSDYPQRRFEAAASKAASPELLLYMAKEEDDLRVADRIIKNSHMPLAALPHLLWTLQRTDEQPAHKRSFRIVAHLISKKASDDECRKLIRLSATPEIRLSLLSSMSSREEFRTQRPHLLKEHVALHPWIVKEVDCDSELLTAMANSPDSGSRRVAAAHKDTSGGLLAKLADDANEYVRWAAAANSNTPADVLDRIDGSEFIHLALAANPSTPPGKLESLSRVGSADVRRFVADHPNADESILRHLASDSAQMVRMTVAGATKSHETLAKLARDRAARVACEAAANEHLPSEAVIYLAAHDSHEVQHQVAKRSDCPTEALKILIQSGDDQVALAAYRHPRLDSLSPRTASGVRKLASAYVAEQAEQLQERERLAEEGYWRDD